VIRATGVLLKGDWVSSDGFFVDPDALSVARAGVGRLVGELREFAGVGPASDVFGHERLARAVDEFHERWRGGVRALAAEGESLHRRLGETIAEYRRIDEDVAGVFRGIHGGR
jgi:hypothetical protein